MDRCNWDISCGHTFDDEWYDHLDTCVKFSEKPLHATQWSTGELLTDGCHIDLSCDFEMKPIKFCAHHMLSLKDLMKDGTWFVDETIGFKTENGLCRGAMVTLR